jgi:hypothetical protein
MYILLNCSEPNEEKAQFLAHFGAGFLVWFVHLPALSVVATEIAPLWRLKIVLGMIVVVYILSNRYVL